MNTSLPFSWYPSHLVWKVTWHPVTHGYPLPASPSWGGTAAFCLLPGNSAWWFCSPQAGSHIQTLMGSQSLQHRSREQQPYEGNINKVTIQQFQSPLPIQIPSSQATRGPQPGRCLIQTKGQRSMDGYPEQVRTALVTVNKHSESYNNSMLHVGLLYMTFIIGTDYCFQWLWAMTHW